MTESRDALPLSVTCSPDDRLVDAVRALIGRVGTLAGDPGRVQPFTAAVEQVMTWVLAHPGALTGDVALRFDRDGDRLLGHLHWAVSGAVVVPDTVTSGPDVQVACDVDGPQVRCRVSCRCA